MRLLEFSQSGKYHTVVCQRFGIFGAEPDGVCKDVGGRRQITVGKQESGQPDLVFSTFCAFCPDPVDQSHLRLDRLNETACTIMCQRLIALLLQDLFAIRQGYRSQKICTAYR